MRRPIPKDNEEIFAARLLAFLLFLLIAASSFAFLTDSWRSEAKGNAGQAALRTEVEFRTKITRQTINLIKSFEGYSPTCVDWLDGHATIGYGYLMHFGPCTAADNAIYMTRQEASEQLREDLVFFKDRVNELTIAPINQKIGSALISFSYNVGDNALQESTLLELLNQEKYYRAAKQFDLWINGPNGALPGLVKRRAIEKKMFLQGVSRLIAS